MLYIIYDEIDEKNWLIFEAPNDRAAKRLMRQNILKYQKDVDFDFSLRKFDKLPCTDILPVVINSDELFKSDDKIEEEEEIE